MLATVRYEIATYEGDIHVNVSADDDDDTIIAKAKRIAERRGIGFSGPCYESWRVIKRQEV